MQIVDCHVYAPSYKHSKNHGEQSGIHAYTVRGNREEPLHVEYNVQWFFKERTMFNLSHLYNAMYSLQLFLK